MEEPTKQDTTQDAGAEAVQDPPAAGAQGDGDGGDAPTEPESDK